MAGVAAHVEPDREAEASDDDGHRHRDQDRAVGDVGHEAAREDGDAGVVERGDAVEQALPRGAAHRAAAAMSSTNQDERGDGLHRHGETDDRQDQAAHPAQVVGVHLGLGDQNGCAAPGAGRPARAAAGAGDDAEAADLDQCQDHRLAGGAPMKVATSTGSCR
jgi:hypothetical protein